MDEYHSLSHTVWDCKFHVVFIPKCRRKTLYFELLCGLRYEAHQLPSNLVWLVGINPLSHRLVALRPRLASDRLQSFVPRSRARRNRVSSTPGRERPWCGVAPAKVP